MCLLFCFTFLILLFLYYDIGANTSISLFKTSNAVLYSKLVKTNNLHIPLLKTCLDHYHRPQDIRPKENRAC